MHIFVMCTPVKTNAKNKKVFAMNENIRYHGQTKLLSSPRDLTKKKHSKIGHFQI